MTLQRLFQYTIERIPEAVTVIAEIDKAIKVDRNISFKELIGGKNN